MSGIFACAIPLQGIVPASYDSNYTRPVSFYVNYLLPPTLIALAFGAAIAVFGWYLFSKTELENSSKIVASLGVFALAFLFAATMFGEPTLAATFVDLFPSHAALC